MSPSTSSSTFGARPSFGALLVAGALVAGADAGVLDEAWSHQGHVHSSGAGSETSGLSKLLREIEGGGKIRSFVQRWFMPSLPDISIGSGKSEVTVRADGLKEQTFISPPMTLENGDIVNKWLPIDWPEGHILAKSFSADVVEATPEGKAPPPTPCCGGEHEADRDTSFLHHWTVNKWQATKKWFSDLVKEGGREFSANMDSDGIWALVNDAGFNDGANGPCWDATLHVFFGIGNEVRGKPIHSDREAYEFPDPYGIEFDGDSMRQRGEFMTLNTHLIDLRNVTNTRACTECECSYLNSTGAGPATIGGLSCCHSTSFNGAKCQVFPAAQKTNKTYYIRYTLHWRDFEPAVSKPLEAITFDATDNNTKWGDFPFVPGGFKETHVALHNDPTTVAAVSDPRSGVYMGFSACHVEYFVPHCQTPDCTHTIHNSWELPYPMEFVFTRSHFHIGGQTARLWSDQGDICTSNSTYNEKGWLLDISTCTAGGLNGPPVQRVERGAKVYTEFVYKQDDLPHYGVMAMSFVYVHIPKEDRRWKATSVFV